MFGTFLILNRNSETFRKFLTDPSSILFNIPSLIIDIITNTWQIIFLILAFLAFIFINDGIVLGDKNSHIATIHLAQLSYLYFLLGLLNIPTLLLNLSKVANNFKAKMTIMTLVVIFWYFVEKKRIEHPYLLADNRHIAFYLYKRIFSTNLRHLTAPFSALSCYVSYFLWEGKSKAWSFMLFTVFSFLCCVPQALFEIRYFIPSIIVWQSYSKINSKLQIFWNILTSSVMLVLFLSKDVHWHDLERVQMIIW